MQTLQLQCHESGTQRRSPCSIACSMARIGSAGGTFRIEKGTTELNTGESKREVESAARLHNQGDLVYLYTSCTTVEALHKLFKKYYTVTAAVCGSTIMHRNHFTQSVHFYNTPRLSGCHGLQPLRSTQQSTSDSISDSVSSSRTIGLGVRYGSPPGPCGPPLCH